MRTPSLTYSDRAIYEAILAQRQEGLHINPDSFNAFLDDVRVPQEARQKLHNLFAWLLYFHEKASSAQPNNSSFDSGIPFSLPINWPNVERFLTTSILSGVELGCDKESFFERLRELVSQTNKSSWHHFNLSNNLHRLSHEIFNDWPTEIKRLVLFTLPMSNPNQAANFSGTDLSGLDLRGIDISYAHFANATLYGTDFSGAICKESHFLNANLRHAKLEKVWGVSASFEGADLSHTVLTDADFRGANFQCASLLYANLQRANLAEANLRQLSAKDANFSEVKLDLSNCTAADFLCADFSRASLNGADLSQANFICAELNQAHLMNARMREANFSEAIFDGAVLTGAQLQATDLESANLNNAKIEHANMTGTNLCDATFHEANLANTIFFNVDCHGADFSRANFGSQLHFQFADNAFSFDVLSDEILDRHFNHLDNDTSTLLSIHGISTQYTAQKVEIVGGMIERLHQAQRAGTNLSGVAASLADFFFSQHIYYQHSAVAEFLAAWLIPNRIAHWEQAPLGRINNVATLKMLSSQVLKSIQQPDWLLQHQCFINQLLVNLRPNPMTLDLYTEIKTVMSNHALVKQVLSTPIAHLLTDDEYFFVHPDGLQVFVCDEKLFAPIAMNADHNGMTMPLWSAHWLFSRPNLHAHFEFKKIDGMLDEVLPSYPLLAHSYAASDPKGIRADFIRLVLPNLVDVGANMAVDTKDYGRLFLYSCQRSVIGCDMKLTSFSDQSALVGKFNVAFVAYAPPMIKPEHTGQIWLNFLRKMPMLSDTPYHQAVLLFSLATFYTHASSSQIFGEELDSPNILRLYASGLLREAYSLAPDFFGTCQEGATLVYDEWQNKLLGSNREFTCTAVLSEKMIGHVDEKSLGNSTVKRIFTEIYPIAWR